MIRASCQQFKFILPYTISQLKTARITFWQKDNEGTTECSLPITKTLAFATDRKAFVQFRGLTTDEFAFASRIMPISVYPVCDDTILE